MSIELQDTRYGVADGVATITLHRPAQLNAWTPLMEREVRASIACAERDPAVRVIVITGEGRGFCAGGDLGGTSRLSDEGFDEGLGDEPLPEAAIDPPSGLAGRFSYLLGLDKPVIAAVNGPATGVGFVLMCFADIRFGSVDGKLSTSFARFGLPAEHGISWLLPRLVGVARATEWLLSGRTFRAGDDDARSLFHHLEEDADQVAGAAHTYAIEMAQRCSPHATRVIKRQLYGDLDRALDPSAIEAHALMLELVTGADLRAGVDAFVERRLPTFLDPRVEAAR